MEKTAITAAIAAVPIHAIGTEAATIVDIAEMVHAVPLKTAGHAIVTADHVNIVVMEAATAERTAHPVTLTADLAVNGAAMEAVTTAKTVIVAPVIVAHVNIVVTAAVTTAKTAIVAPGIAAHVADIAVILSATAKKMFIPAKTTATAAVTDIAAALLGKTAHPATVIADLATRATAIVKAALTALEVPPVNAIQEAVM